MSDAPKDVAKATPVKKAVKKSPAKPKAAKVTVAQKVAAPAVAPTPIAKVSVKTTPRPKEVPVTPKVTPTSTVAPAPVAAVKPAAVKPAPVETAPLTSELEFISKKALIKFKSFGLATKVILLLIAIGVIAKLIHAI